MVVLADNLENLKKLSWCQNPEVRFGCYRLGTLPALTEAYAGLGLTYTDSTGVGSWTAVGLASQLRSLRNLSMGNHLYS